LEDVIEIVNFDGIAPIPECLTHGMPISDRTVERYTEPTRGFVADCLRSSNDNCNGIPYVDRLFTRVARVQDNQLYAPVFQQAGKRPARDRPVTPIIVAQDNAVC
jgi:hypothetical protein